MLEAMTVLDTLQVGSEVVVASAHRTPKKTESTRRRPRRAGSAC